MKQIPLAKPDFDQRELDAVRRVLDSGWVVQGSEVEAFETAIAELHQAKHCIVVSSGTAALHLSYLAMRIGPGDAVFIPSFAWPAAANMAMIVGARPVFVDVLPGTYNIDPEDLRVCIEQCVEKRWGKPRAIVPVHEFGLAADMDPIMAVAGDFDLEVIEDAACALGAAYCGHPVGTIGRLGTFSFHPRKAITTGEGGAIITNDDVLAEKCRIWRNHGQESINGKRDFTVPGLNYRMTEIQAAIGRVQLEKFSSILEQRKKLVEVYLRELDDCPNIILPTDDPEHTWQTFMVVLNDNISRDAVIKRMSDYGIGVGPGSVAAHCGEVCKQKLGYKPSDLSVSMFLDSHGLALPLFLALEVSDIEYIVNKMHKVLQETNSVQR